MNQLTLIIIIWLIAGIIGFYAQIYLNKEYQKILDKHLEKGNKK